MNNSSKRSRGPFGFVVSDGERIYYETYGQGDAVVFTHGFGGNHAIWYQQVPQFASYFRVVTWDQRGFGKSSNKANRAGPEAAISDLSHILNHLDIDRAHLVGQSMGGAVVMGLALENPERVGKLILGDTDAGVSTPRVEEALDDLERKAKASPDPTALPIGRHPALGKRLANGNIAQAFLYEQIGGMAENPPKNVMTLFRKSSYPHEKFKTFEIPTLFIVGSEDPIFPPETVREVASIIPGSRMTIISDTGHSPYFEDPPKWNEAVLKFLHISKDE
jgi:2-succinyl-6-hydroxy-2,4-cyclohexadiene-1-carboxylate synthase